MTKKLEQTFNLSPAEESMIEELEKRYDHSENPDLKEIARMALDAYKEQMLDSSNFEAKFRARNLEVAQTFLNLAKDCLAKDTDLRLKEEKQNQSDKPKDNSENKPFNRDEFLADLNKDRKKA